VETTLFNGYKIVLNSDDRCVCWRVRREGIWGVHEVKVLEDILKPGMRVVEIGANYGTHTLHMSKLIGPTGQIIAFECNPFVSSKLKKSLEINKISNCILKEMAVSDHAYATFIVYDLDNIGGGYILSENHAKSFDPTAFKLHHKISVTTLDEELKDIHDIDLLKMDAEGAEYLILQGAEKFTQRHPNLKIMMEWG
jgi:FkbM family methyltransferase